MGSRDELAYEIIRSLRRILRRVSEHSRQVAIASGLTVPQILCVRAIADLEREGVATAAAVCQKVNLSPPTVCRIIDRLESAGWIVRERRSIDRRQVALSLSRSARRRLKSMPTPLHDEFLERLQDLPARERKELLSALERIVSMMEATDVEAAPVLLSGVDVKQQH